MSSAFSPREIVSELDRYIVGQHDAKRAVAIALRNRWRRQQLPEGLKDEVLPKNILMIGPTGVGKTEIARRLARLAQAPFLKVEATKFTEVGYVGRDVEQIVRDLIESAIVMTRERLRKQVTAKAEMAAEERVIDALVGEHASAETRQKFRKQLREGSINEREIELQVADTGGMPTFEIPGMPGAQVGMVNLGDMFGKAFGGRTKPRKMTVLESYTVLLAEESDKLLDQVAHDLVDVAANIADLGELGRLDLQEGRLGQARQPAGDLGLADAGGADHQDVLRRDLVADSFWRAATTPAIAQGHGHGPLGLGMADDKAVELGDDLARGKLGHVKVSQPSSVSTVSAPLV